MISFLLVGHLYYVPAAIQHYPLDRLPAQYKQSLHIHFNDRQSCVEAVKAIAKTSELVEDLSCVVIKP